MTTASAEKLSLFLVEDSPADVFLVREAMRDAGLSVALQIAKTARQRFV